MKECLEFALLGTAFIIASGFIGALILEFFGICKSYKEKKINNTENQENP